MKFVNNENYKRISMAFICIVLLFCIWNISIFFIPSVLIALSLIILKIKRRCKFNIIEISIGCLLVYELINLQFSFYKQNGVVYLVEYITVLSCLFIVNDLINTDKNRAFIIMYISIIACGLALLNIPVFVYKYCELAVTGFDDFTQFRFLFAPMGLLSNEWVTLMLCLLPFPIMGLFASRNVVNKSYIHISNSYLLYVYITTIGLIIFNILISFSRAGFLSILLFVILLNTFWGFKKVLSVKRIIFINFIFLLLLISFSFFFTRNISSTINSSISHQRSTEGRYEQWENAINITKNSFFLGIGSNNYALVTSRIQNKKIDATFSGRVNNTFIQLLIEKGFIGVILWSSLFILFCIHTYQKLKKNGSNTEKAITINLSFG